MIPTVTPPSLPIAGQPHRFPVRRVLCIGRNYAAHAREMGDDGRSPPFHFIKSAHALGQATPEGQLVYPPQTANLHHEVELVLALGGAPGAPSIFAYGVGLDMTRRDLQAQAKAKGRPWASGKDFDGAAWCGPLVPAPAQVGPSIHLQVDGVEVQRGTLDQMIWQPQEILTVLCELMTLAPGDLIFTGTPAGVGPVLPGQIMDAHVDGLPPLRVHVLPPQGS